MVANWIFRDTNLVAFLESVAALSGYDLLPDEISAIEYGVRVTDQERDQWYQYAFAGKSPVSLSIAADPGTDIVHIRAECSDDFKPTIEALLFVFQEYQVKPLPR